MKLVPESEDSQSSSLNETPIEFTPIVMFSLPESSNDDCNDSKFQIVIKPNGLELDDDAESELKKCKCSQNVEAENKQLELGSEENSVGLSDSLNENAAHIVVPLSAVPMKGVCQNDSENIQGHGVCEDDLENMKEIGVCENDSENFQEDGVCNDSENIQEDEIFLTASELGDIAECELKKFKVLEEKEMMFEDLEMFESGPSGSVNKVVNQEPKLSLSAEENVKMAQGVFENATENMKDVDMLEFENSDSVTKTANAKPKSPISAKKNEKMAPGVCDNTTENIEDVDILEFERSSSVENTANAKPKSSISAKKKEKEIAECELKKFKVLEEKEMMFEDLEMFESGPSGSVNKVVNQEPKLSLSAEENVKMVQGVCENATQNIEDLEQFKYAHPGSVDSFLKSKGKLPSSFEKKKRKNIGNGSTKISSPTSGMNIGFYNLMGCVDENESGDFMQTAINRGMDFPRPRWWPHEGPPETFDG